MEMALRLAEIKVQYRTLGTYRPAIKSSETTAQVIRPYFDDSIEHKELFYAIFLSRSNSVLAIMKVSEGGRACTIVDVPIIMQGLILSNASGLIVAHNHPSGNANPSEADKKLTTQIKSACKLIGFEFLDHMILTKDTYTSFADEGLLF